MSTETLDVDSILTLVLRNPLGFLSFWIPKEEGHFSLENMQKILFLAILVKFIGIRNATGRVKHQQQRNVISIIGINILFTIYTKHLNLKD